MGFRRSEVRILSPRHCKPRCNNKLQRGFFMETSACLAEGRECLSRTLGAYNGTSRGCCLSRGKLVLKQGLFGIFENPRGPDRPSSLRQKRKTPVFPSGTGTREGGWGA